MKHATHALAAVAAGGLLLAGGCPDERPAKDCRRQLAALRPWIEKLAVGAVAVGREGAPLVRLPRAKPATAMLATAVVQRDAVRFEGRVQPLAEGRVPGIEKDLERIANNLALTKTPRPTRAYLAADRDAPWSQVAAVVRSFERAGIREVGFAFAIDDPVRPPGRSSIEGELKVMRRIDQPALKAEQLAEMFRRVLYDPCPAAVARAKELAAVDPSRARETFFNGLRAVLPSCGCRVDLPSLKALLYANYHVKPTGVVWRRIGAHGTALALPAKTPWSESHRRVVASKRAQLLAFRVAR